MDTIKLNYCKAPYFNDVFPIICTILTFESRNLFTFLRNSIEIISDYLEIDTMIIKRSDTDYDTKLSKSQMGIEICKKLNAETYLNSEGGVKLYDPKEFFENGIKLRFAKRWPLNYENEFGATDGTLSILDVLMWNDRAFLISQLSLIDYYEV